MLQSAESPAPVVELEKFDDLQATRITQPATQADQKTRSQALRRILTTMSRIFCFRSRDFAEHQKLRADLRDITP